MARDGILEQATRFTMDDRRWPIVTISSPRWDVNILEFFDLVDACLGRGDMFATIHDIRGMPILDAAQRKKFADYIRLKGPQLRLRVAAHAVVVNSSIERGLVATVVWLIQAPFPMRVFASMYEAESWVSKQLSKGRS